MNILDLLARAFTFAKAFLNPLSVGLKPKSATCCNTASASLINLLAISLFSLSVFALENIAVIDMRTAVLSTQAADNALKALEEDATYAANLEDAQTLQAERQAIAENFEKNRETLSQEEIAKMQKDIQDKSKDLEFIAGKLQQAQEETIQRIFVENSA